MAVLLPRWMSRGALALTLIALPVAAQDTASEEDGGGFLENLIEDRLSGPGFQVQVRGFEGALSSRATLAQLTISDDEGPWLTINNAVLDWSRTALLRGRLQVDELTAEEILLPRLPQPDDSVDLPSAEARPFSLPDLPVSVQLGQLQIDRIELGQPVIGVAAALSLEGSASLAGGEGEVDIRANRLNGQDDSYAVSGSYANDDNALTLDVRAQEESGGIIATLIDLPGRPSLDLSVTGDGPLSDFTAEIALATDGEPRLDGTVTLLEEDGARRFAADLGGDIAPVFTPQYRPFFGPDIQLALQGAQQADGAIDISRLSLSAQSLDLQGQVRLDADKVPTLIDVTGTISSDSGPVVLPVGQDLRVGGVDLDVQFDASAGDAWTGVLRVQGLDQPGAEIADITLDGQGTIDNGADSLSVTTNFDFDATGLSFDNGGVTQALGDALTGRLEIDYATGAPVRMDVLRLVGDGFRLTGEGTLDPAGENTPLTLDAQLDAEDLALFSALAGRPLGGGISARVDLGATLVDQGFDVALDGTATDLTVGLEQLDPLLRGTTDLTLRAQRDAAGTRVETLTLDNEAIDLGATADLTSEGGSAQADLRIDNLGRIDPALDGPATLTFDATNPGDRWVVDLQAEGARAQVNADVTISDLDGTSPLVQGEADVTAADLAQFTPFAGRDLGGSVDLRVNGQARVDGSVVKGDVAGQVTDVAIGQPELDRLLRGRTGITASVDKTLDLIEVPTLDISNPQIDVTGNATIAPQNGTVDLNIDLPDLAQVVPSMSGPATLTLDGIEDATGWNVDLNANGAGAEITADARLTDVYGAVSPLGEGTMRIDIADLSNFSEIARRELGGSVDLAAEGRARFDLSTLRVTLDGTTRDIAVDIPEVNRLLRGDTAIEADVEKDGDRIDVPRLRIDNEQITVAGTANVRPENSAVDLTVDMPDLSEVVPSMTGTANLTLDAIEDATGWTVDLDATGAGAEIAAQGRVSDLGQDGTSPLGAGTVRIDIDDLSNFSEIARRELGGSVTLDAEGQARFDLSAADARIEGTTRDLALGQPELNRLLAGTTQIAGAGSKDGTAIVLDRLNVANPQVDVTANGQYGPGDSAVQANITFPELGAIIPEMSGRGVLDLFAEETGETWQVTLDADGAGVDLAARAEVADLMATPLVDGTVTLSAADLSRFRRLANRPLAGSVQLDASGRARIDGSRFDVTADATADRLAIGLAQVDQLLAGQTTLALEASRDGATAPIRVGRFVLDAPGIDANAQGSLLGGASDLTFDARLADLSRFVPEIPGPVTVEGQAGQAGASFTLNVDVQGPQGMEADISGRIAESFGTANLNMSGSAPLRVANPFLQPQSVAGDANFDVALNGPLALTSVTGTVTVAQGRFVAPTVPLVLEDLNATARLDGQSVRLNATARNAEGGTVSVSGPIALSGGYDAGLDVTLDDFVLQDPRLYLTEVDGTIGVDGPLTGGATIAGTLTLDETEVRIPSTGLGATGPVPDGLVHLNEPADVRATRARAGLIDDGSGGGGGGTGGGGYNLDVTILAPNQIFIRGRGLDAEMGGSLTLRGTTANIIPAGQFDLIRGRIDLLGQRILLTEGQVTLRGDFSPFVRLVAETDAGDVTVFIIVEGEVSDPTIDFRSNPELPSDEVLSRLLFGQSIDNISPLQAAQLASAVATLAGRGGVGIVANLRQQTGLDDLDITTDADGNVGVRAGKYLSENLYTDVTVGASGTAEINLNLDVTRSLTVRGSAGNDGETSLGIFFERDY